MAEIKGITEQSLRAAWKEVRLGLRRAPYRDALDHLEFDVDDDVWIKRLLKRIDSGEYSPEIPRRCSVSKSKGFDRIITVPAVPDIVLYRAVVDYLYGLSKDHQVKHAYFAQSALSKAVSAASAEAAIAIDKSKELDVDGYPISSKWVFFEWLKYDQYRKHLIFEKLYAYIVVTDITNFFDSILYNRIEESLYELQAPSRMVSLLFHMLEAFSLRDEMVPVQRIGLPVDPCDCSRVLAHMMLLPHDLRMVSAVGEDAYVRWMDDQNLGVSSLEEGLSVLAQVGSSLRKLHLTPNVGKTSILSLAEAKRHFHFNANASLDVLDGMPYKTTAQRSSLKTAVEKEWGRALKLEGVGEWSKILKRFYRVAARARSAIMLSRAKNDLLSAPSLTNRIVDYVRYVDSAENFLDFVSATLSDKRQIYPDVSYELLDGLLRFDPTPVAAKRIRVFAVKLLNVDPSVEFAGLAQARALAPLLILRYGTAPTLNVLFKKLRDEGDELPIDLTRSICAVVGGSKKRGANAVKSAASKLLRNHLSHFVKLLNKVSRFDAVPNRFKERIIIHHDSITAAPRVDMRVILTARILGLSKEPAVHQWLKMIKAKHLAKPLSDFDRKLINRLWPTATHNA